MAAKAGDVEAALVLAIDLISDDAAQHLKHIIGGRAAVLLPVVADETTGFNAIPDAMAWSAMIGNLGTALTIAGVGTLWLNGLEPWPVVWIAFGIAIMSFATQLLNRLEAEN